MTGQRRPLDAGRKDALGRTVRVAAGDVAGRADAPPPLVAGSGPRIVKVVDTRDRIEVDDRWVALSGTGDGHVCDRCGRLHEVHALVDVGDGTSVTVGTGCAVQVLAGAGVDVDRLEVFEKAAGRAARAAKALTKARGEVADLEEKAALWAEIVAEASVGAPGVDRVVEIDPHVKAERSDGRYVTLEVVHDGVTANQSGFVSHDEPGRLDEFRSMCVDWWVGLRARTMLAARLGVEPDADVFRVAYPFEKAADRLETAQDRVVKAEGKYRAVSDELADL